MAPTTPPTTDPLGLVRAGVTSTLKDFLSRYPHVDADRLLTESGFDLAALGNHEKTHTLRSMLTFLENAARETGDECFGHAFATQVPVNDLDVLGYVALHSPTLGAAHQSACRYLAVQQTLGRLSLRRGRVDAYITYSMKVPAGVVLKQHVEMVLTGVVKFTREATGLPDWSPRQVRFTHTAPCDPARLERYFGSPVRFGQAENAVIFPSRDLDLPLRSPDPLLLPILQRHANDLLSRMPHTGEFVTTVRRQLAELLRAGKVGIDDAAIRLRTSSRSLQRRLTESGTTFQELLAETRLALAKQYLCDRALPLMEVAFLLGYSDVTAFNRAFHRWTGLTPYDFRRRSA